MPLKSVSGLGLTIQFSSVAQSCPTLQPHGPQHTRLPCPSPTPGVYSNPCPLSWWCHPTISFSVVPFSSCLQSFPASRVFSNESVLHIRWPKYWSCSFSISLSNEYSGLISFRMDWLDLLAVQGTLKSLLQHHSSKAWVLWRSAFLILQISHPYMTTGKTIALTRQTFVGKVMSLLFNMLSTKCGQISCCYCVLNPRIFVGEDKSHFGVSVLHPQIWSQNCLTNNFWFQKAHKTSQKCILGFHLFLGRIAVIINVYSWHIIGFPFSNI